MKTSDPNYTRANYVMDHRAKDMATLAQAIVSEDEEVIKQYDLESENERGSILLILRFLIIIIKQTI